MFILIVFVYSAVTRHHVLHEEDPVHVVSESLQRSFHSNSVKNDSIRVLDKIEEPIKLDDLSFSASSLELPPVPFYPELFWEKSLPGHNLSHFLRKM